MCDIFSVRKGTLVLVLDDRGGQRGVEDKSLLPNPPRGGGNESPPPHGGYRGEESEQRLCSHTNSVRSQSIVKSVYDTHRFEKFLETEQFTLSSQGCLTGATFCVRKGAKVHVAGDPTGSVGRPNSSPLPNPPRGRGGNKCPPVHGGTTGGIPL